MTSKINSKNQEINLKKNKKIARFSREEILRKQNDAPR